MSSTKSKRKHWDKYKGAAADTRRHRQHFKASGVVKRAYDEAEARAAAARLDDLQPGKSHTAYPCPICPSWHVGSERIAGAAS